MLETSELDKIAHINSLIHVCKNVAVRFSLDEFGTGYSSFTYPKNLSKDPLKLTRAFYKTC